MKMFLVAFFTFFSRFFNLKVLRPLIVVFFLGSYSSIYATTFNSSFTTLTPTNKSCYSGSFLVDYTVTVPPPSGYTYPTSYTFNLSLTKFELVKASVPGTILATNWGGTTSSSPTISGSFDISSIAGISIKPGVYTIFATIMINDIAGMVSTSSTTSTTFTVGYETQWADLTDMTALPNLISARRDVVTAGTTYASCLSSNMTPTLTVGWYELSAQFSSVTTSRSVFVPLGGSISSAFSPSATSDYVEFRKGGTITTTSGEGIYVKKAGSLWKLQGVVLADRIRIERVTGSGEVRYYLTNTTTRLNARYVSDGSLSSNFQSTISGELSIIGYSTLVDDGLSNVISSFLCSESSVIYAQLSRSLEGVNYDAVGELNFYHDEEYAPTINTVLNYRILDWQHRTLQSSAAMAGSTVITANRIYGDNRFRLPLAASIVVGSTYTLEVTNEKKEVFYLRFTRR